MSTGRNEEHDPLTETEEDDLLLAEACKRLQKSGEKPGIPLEKVMEDLGISWKDLEAIPDIEIDMK